MLDFADLNLDQVLHAHQASMAAVHSLSCTVNRTDSYPKENTVQLKYWRRGDLMRAHETRSDNSAIADGLVKDSVAIRVSRNISIAGQPEEIGATREASRSPFFTCDPPFELLQTFVRFPRFDAPLATFLSQKHNSLKLSARKEGGRDLIQIDLSMPNPVNAASHWDFEIWMDPGMNHQVRKLITRIDGDDGGRTEREIIKFSEVTPGLFFPVESQLNQYQNGKVIAVIKTKVSDLKVNETIDDSVFELAIPVGASVTDKIAGSTYIVAADHSRIKVAAAPSDREMLSGTLVTASSPPPTPWKEAHPEPGANLLWYALAIVFAVLALVVFGVRFRNMKSH